MSIAAVTAKSYKTRWFVGGFIILNNMKHETNYVHKIHNG